MFRKIFRAVGNVAKGIWQGVVKDLLPIPDFKGASKDFRAKSVAKQIRSEAASLDGLARTAVDLLDDGKLNDSIDDQFVQTVTRIVTSSAGLIGLAVYLISEFF